MAEQKAPDEQLTRAIRTLLPGLRVANYVERWSPTSPAVAALNILCEAVGESVEVAGDLQDPDVPTAHERRPAGNPTPTPVASATDTTGAGA